ncbi:MULTISPECIES: hypothetical protein [Alicyclobacillus]|uniref:Phenylacetic acid degradation B n=1 Tax=Alicyclobacillus vulcanalis TaxID=252246 RepID=A0A1N7LL67_9BACL|nr:MULTISPECIES: hypothetical protein [Alicyclobacillus]SIS74580.1 Phenylacetic acid degradation B [Alicyclobacillus vulcanalis]
MTRTWRRYEVFARSQRGDPFCHIGSVEAFSDVAARILAHHIYDEESWFDLAVVPSEQFGWVIRQGNRSIRVEGA